VKQQTKVLLLMGGRVVDVDIHGVLKRSGIDLLFGNGTVFLLCFFLWKKKKMEKKMETNGHISADEQNCISAPTMASTPTKLQTLFILSRYQTLLVK
jgi:hypothetical protein